MYRGGFSNWWNTNSRVCHRACVFGVFGGGGEHRRCVACASRTSYQLPFHRRLDEGGSAFPKLTASAPVWDEPWALVQSAAWASASALL
jgi:hypothetical protein